MHGRFIRGKTCTMGKAGRVWRFSLIMSSGFDSRASGQEDKLCISDG
jgi:hypothetical protein